MVNHACNLGMSYIHGEMTLGTKSSIGLFDSILCRTKKAAIILRYLLDYYIILGNHYS